MARAGAGETLFPVLKNEAREVRTALWFRPAASCVAAAVAAGILASADALLPRGSLDWLPEANVQTVQELLKLLATGMLTVATVTLSVLMLVLNLAAAQVSPRATPAVMADVVTQNALSTFLATFVYALTALMFIAFDVVSGAGGVALMFIGALLLALNAVRYIVQWAHHVAQVLKINRMIERIHRHGTTVLEAYLSDSDAGHCEAFAGAAEGAAEGVAAVRPRTAGYVQLIDGARLHELACAHDLAVRLHVQQGDFVHPHGSLMELHGPRPAEEALDALRVTVVIGFERSHEGDPRLAFVLLAEIACRAVSPAINDPQSALACVQYLGALLAVAGTCPANGYPATRSADGRVEFIRPDFPAMLQRAFRPIMRDGAAMAEVIIAIMRVLRDLAAGVAPDYLDSLEREARRAQAFGEDSLLLDADRRLLGEIAEELRGIVARRLIV